MDRGAYHKESDMATEACVHTDMYIYHAFIKKFLLYFRQCWVFVAACRLSLFVVSGGYSLVKVHGFLTAAASLEHGSRALRLSICARV